MIKALIAVYLYHHNNTEKIAHAMAEELGAVVKYPADINPVALQDFDLVGFGAGIDSGRHYQPMLAFAGSLPAAAGKMAFLFSTSGVHGRKKMLSDHAALRKILLAKGYCIVDEYACAGFNTNSILKYFGGLNKRKPDKNDLQGAKVFAKAVLCKCTDECGDAL